jgi:succinate dehydrogenase / fumarate reductase, cytochrome b subunit
VNKKRPVNLDLVSIRFPITAIVSILHRLSGIFLFFAIPFLLYFLHTSLHSQAGFDQVSAYTQVFWVKFITFIILSGLIYHLFAGIRHLIMDCGIGETRQGGKIGAYILLIVSIISILATGVWLWGM